MNIIVSRRRAWFGRWKVTRFFILFSAVKILGKAPGNSVPVPHLVVRLSLIFRHFPALEVVRKVLLLFLRIKVVRLLLLLGLKVPMGGRFVVAWVGKAFPQTGLFGELGKVFQPVGLALGRVRGSQEHVVIHVADQLFVLGDNRVEDARRVAPRVDAVYVIESVIRADRFSLSFLLSN